MFQKRKFCSSVDKDEEGIMNQKYPGEDDEDVILLLLLFDTDQS